MFAVLASLGLANAATVTDVLTADLFPATGSSYVDFSNVTVTSSAVYAGNSAKSDASAIQLRSKNNSGIVTTASAGTVKKITIVWDGATSGGRTIDVYGKSTAYTSATDLFGSADVQGVLIGSIVKGKSELVVEGDYQFVGIRSNFGALYATSISVEWETGGDTPVVLKAPVISGVENGVEYKSAKVAISYPAGATSMTWAVTKDGAAWKGGDATSAVLVDVTEDGSYEVSASATDGTTTKTAENVVFTIKAPAVPAVGYEAMDVANVKEGNYIIVGENEGKFYMMKNETYSVNYVAATETTLDGTESFSSANLFTIKKQGEGYTIQSADGKFVTIEKSTNGTKTFYNLRVGKDASDAVWKFADADGGKVQATYGEFTNFMSFIWYAKVEPGVPEFSTGYRDSHIRPAFYYVGDVTPVEPEAVKVASIAEFYTKGLADSEPEYEFTCPLTATYQSGKNLYVTDGTDGLLIYGQSDKVCVNGFGLAPGVKGKFSNFNGTYQLTNAVLSEITSGKGVAPEEMTIDGITAEKQNRYVVIRNAMLDTAEGVTTLSDDTGSIDAFDKGFIAFPADESKIYDVTAMTAYFKGQVQVYPVNFTEIPEEAVQEPGIGISGYPLNPDADEHIYYGEVDVVVVKADDVASIHVVVTKGGVEVDNVTATKDWRNTYSEVGKYLISATATNGSLTSAPIEVEFEIVPEPVLNAPTFSLAEGTYTGSQIVTIEGYEGSMIVGTCNNDDVYDYSPCDVTLAAPATGEITYVLTVHSELGERQSEESTATYVIKAGEPAAEGAFQLVSSAEMLKEGSKVILVSETNAMSTVQNMKNAAKQFRQSTTVVVEGDVVPAIGADVAVFTVGKDGDNYTFYNAATKTDTGVAMPGYLCAVSNDKNALGVEESLSDNGKWSVEFDGSAVKMLAQGGFTRNLLQFNYNGFRCYNPSTTTVDTKLSIYCQVESGVDDVATGMVKIAGEEGAIRVVAESADVTVYTMTGQAVAAAAVEGEATIRLAAGFYIVRAGGTTVKVVVK